MNASEKPRRDVTLQEKSDEVGKTLGTENGLNETVQLLKSPANAAHLARSIEQFRNGAVSQQDLVAAVRRQLPAELDFVCLGRRHQWQSRLLDELLLDFIKKLAGAESGV
jgi:hypothetical protein